MARSNPSVMSHQFSQIPNVELQRSSFDRSHGLKTTFDAGLLIPILVDEALPGDTFNLNMTGFARLATPIFPIMDNMYMETHFFAVPYRLVWDNWQKFNGEQDNPGDSTDFLIPETSAPAGTGYTTNSFGDYMGLPTDVADFTHSVLPFRAYSLIFNEWFRDQNLQDSEVLVTDDGPDLTSNYTLRRRAKRHDYFTSCLPFPQKGDPVELPLGATAPVVPSGDEIPTFRDVGMAGNPKNIVGNTTAIEMHWSIEPGQTDDYKWADPSLEADLSAATAATINGIREAFQVQRMFEKDARGGTRYTEIIRSHFGVTSPDSRLQRPEYLGGGSTPIIISPVAQTSSSQDSQGPIDTPQANLAAIGTASLNRHGFTKSFTEHCIIIGLLSVRADLTYQQGLNRMWSRSTRFDFYWPSFANLGEQAVLNQEIFTDGTARDDLVFGYQERFAEYRYKQSQITGLFRSAAPESLDAWHLSQDFELFPPDLNEQFIIEQPPVDRIIAIPDEPHFLFDSYFSMRCARPMPLFGVPGLIDHF